MASPRWHRAARLTLPLSLVLAACSAAPGGKKPNGPAEEGRLTLFFTTELKGQLEPCGCTSAPLGDIARWAEVVLQARAGGGAVLYIDGGSSLYESPTPPTTHLGQERLTADFLASLLRDPLAVVALGLGPNDLTEGPAAVRLPRMAANLPATAGVALEPPRVIEAGGVKVGVFGVVAPGAVAALHAQVGDPAAAARDAVAGLRKDGARIVVGILHMDRSAARELVRAAPGIDFALVGQNVPDPASGNGRSISIAPDQIGATWLIEPAAKGQVLSRVDVTLRAGDGMADALGVARIAPLEAEAGKLAADLAGWKADPTADPAFVASKDQELAALRARIATLERQPIQPPPGGSYFTLNQLEVGKRLPCSGQLVAAKQNLDKRVGDANVEAAAGKLPPAPAKGQAGYVGVEECAFCHEGAVEFWKKTRHAGAWNTLVQLGKAADLDCVGCHATGWDQPGGSNLARTKALTSVQCETCHGPGSLHVDAVGERTDTLTLTPPVERCAQACHTPEHSDTFAYEAYLRDVTGEGHGAARRTALGDGPRGRELRAAALEKAGRAIGKGCPK